MTNGELHQRILDIIGPDIDGFTPRDFSMMKFAALGILAQEQNISYSFEELLASVGLTLPGGEA